MYQYIGWRGITHGYRGGRRGGISGVAAAKK